MRLLLSILMGVSAAGMSTLALAHPGHDEMFHSALLAGMLHPFTGLDHLTMGLGLGLLIARSFKQARFVGLGLLLLALVIGFAVGVQHVLSSNIAEYGIVASLMVLAVALWQRANSVFLPMLALLGVFHGMAHGNELATDVSPTLFMLGMMISLAIMYQTGALLGTWMKQHMKWGDRTAAVCTAVVAVFGLA